jgi:ATP-dependent RNA helicase DDX52/ROK1
LATVQTLIIDEADKLFDMGFLSQIDEIVAACTLKTLQKCLFSATIDSHVETLARSIMKDPIRLVIGQKYPNTNSNNLN